MVSALDRQSRFRSEREIVEATVLDRHATAEHYGGAYSRTRAQRDDSGHSCPARADAGIRSSLVAGNGSCGNRNPDRGGETFAPDREQNAPRSRSRRILAASAGMEGQA